MDINLKTEKVIKEFTDYNGHLNVAFYVHIFDIAADVMLDNFNMGGISAKKNKKTTFVDHDKKRIHYRLSMFHKEKKYLAATNEVLSLYVDLNLRKVTEFDKDRIVLMDDFIKRNKSKFNEEKLIFSSKLKKA